MGGHASMFMNCHLQLFQQKYKTKFGFFSFTLRLYLSFSSNKNYSLALRGMGFEQGFCVKWNRINLKKQVKLFIFVF